MPKALHFSSGPNRMYWCHIWSSSTTRGIWNSLELPHSNVPWANGDLRSATELEVISPHQRFGIENASLFWYFYIWYRSSWTFHDGFWFYIDGQVLLKHIVLQRNELHASGGCGHRQCPAGKGGCQTPPNWTGSHRNRPLEHQWCPRYRSVEPYHLPAKSEDIARLSALKESTVHL